MRRAAQILVLAKAPQPGRSKTRLSPPCTPVQAAALAEAALADTLAAVSATRADRRVLLLDGEPGGWVPSGFEVIRQRGDGLDERLAAGFDDAHEAREGLLSLLIGMDTPQVTPSLLRGGLDALSHPGVDAVLGGAADGGWWAIGLRKPQPEVFLGVPMSTSFTGAAQRRRLRALGLRFVHLPILRDVDRIDDARAVAREIPRSRFARALESLGSRVTGLPAAAGAGRWPA